MDTTPQDGMRHCGAVSPLRGRLTRAVMHPDTLLVLVAVLLGAPAVSSTATIQILAFALVSTIFAQSLLVLTGLAGQISLGHAAFFGMGAYGSALLTKTLGLSLLLSRPRRSPVRLQPTCCPFRPAGYARSISR